MNKNKYSDDEILSFLERATGGEDIKAICAEAGISMATFYNWRNKFYQPDTESEEYEKRLLEENQRLKDVVQRLRDEKDMLLDALKSRR